MTIEVRAPTTPGAEEILTPEALTFLEHLHHTFETTRQQRLAARVDRQARLDGGERPDFLPSTAAIRADDGWRIAPIPDDLADRRVEITGPVDRKMIIN